MNDRLLNALSMLNDYSDAKLYASITLAIVVCYVLEKKKLFYFNKRKRCISKKVKANLVKKSEQK